MPNQTHRLIALEKYTLIALGVIGALCVFFPAIDLSISKFAQEQQLKETFIVVVLNNNNYIFLLILIIILLFLGQSPTQSLTTIWQGVKSRTAEFIYVFLSLLLGPIIIVNLILKENFGRARPADITNFGGEQAFSKALMISDQCVNNCSFVSGHASSGFFLLTLAFLPSLQPWRKQLFLLGLCAGFIAGFARIAALRHFFSDIVFCGIFVFCAAWCLSWAFNLFVYKTDTP